MADAVVYMDKNLGVLFITRDEPVPREGEIVQIAPLKSRTVLSVKWVMVRQEKMGNETRAYLVPHVMLTDPW